MNTEALAALQSVRTLLAYQLTPEAVSELLEPIQSLLDGRGSILEHVELTVPYIAAHNAKVEEAMQSAAHAIGMMRNYKEGCCSYKAFECAEDLALHAIRSLRL